MAKIKIWTYTYHPFVMGGRTWQPEGIEIEAEGPFELGKGYQGFLVTAPNGKTFIAEAQTGAFVGATIEGVIDDIIHSDEGVIKQQIKEALEESKRIRLIDIQAFWKQLQCL